MRKAKTVIDGVEYVAEYEAAPRGGNVLRCGGEFAVAVSRVTVADTGQIVSSQEVAEAFEDAISQHLESEWLEEFGGPAHGEDPGCTRQQYLDMVLP